MFLPKGKATLAHLRDLHFITHKQARSWRWHGWFMIGAGLFVMVAMLRSALLESGTESFITAGAAAGGAMMLGAGVGPLVVAIHTRMLADLRAELAEQPTPPPDVVGRSSSSPVPG